MIGLIIGSGFSQFSLELESRDSIETPYGEPSSPVYRTEVGGTRVLVLVRHGAAHTIAPHEVNYRANVWALDDGGAKCVIAVNVVGAIASDFAPGDVAFPDQIIDYTWGRAQSFGAVDGHIPHVDFTEPFDPELRAALAAAAAELGMPVRRGVYGVTQGPRLESAAEIDRLERDGCAMVGMTAMPEAALARELGLPYALCAVAVNYAAGRSRQGTSIHAELEASIGVGMERVAALLGSALPAIAATM